VQEPLNPQHLGHFRHGGVAVGLAHAHGAQRKDDVFLHGHVRKKRKRLEHEGDVAVGDAQALHVTPVDGGCARRYRFQPGNRAQGRGLSAPL
jgi:hypothetical protein